MLCCSSVQNLPMASYITQKKHTSSADLYHLNRSGACLCSDVLFCHFTSPHLMHSNHSDLTISQTCQYHFYNEVIIWMFSFGIISGFSNPCCPTLFIIFAWFSPFLQVLAANIILSNELSLMNLSKCNTPMPHPWHSLSFYCALFLWGTLHESRSFDPFLCCCIFFISCTKSSG